MMNTINDLSYHQQLCWGENPNRYLLFANPFMLIKYLAENAWEDYLYWQQTDRKTLKRINTLIKDIHCQPFDGLGDPEPLKHNWSKH